MRFFLFLCLVSYFQSISANDYSLFGLDIEKGYSFISGTLRKSEPKIKCWQEPRTSKCSGSFRHHETLEGIEALFWPRFNGKYPSPIAEETDRKNVGKVIWLQLNFKKSIKGEAVLNALKKKFKRQSDFKITKPLNKKPRINFSEGYLVLDEGPSSNGSCYESFTDPGCYIGSVKYENDLLHDQFIRFDKIARNAWRKIEEKKNQRSSVEGL